MLLALQQRVHVIRQTRFESSCGSLCLSHTVLITRQSSVPPVCLRPASPATHVSDTCAPIPCAVADTTFARNQRDPSSSAPAVDSVRANESPVAPYHQQSADSRSSRKNPAIATPPTVVCCAHSSP